MSHTCSNCDKSYKSQCWLKKHELNCVVKEKKSNSESSIKLSEMELEIVRLKTRLIEMKKNYDKLMIDSNYTVVEYGILMELMLINNRFMESEHMDMIKSNVRRKYYDAYIHKKAIERSNKEREEYMGQRLYTVMQDMYETNKDTDNESNYTNPSEQLLNHIFNKIYVDKD